MYSVSVKTLANWRTAGRGPKFRRIGNKILYPKSQVEAWWAEHLHSSTADYPERSATLAVDAELDRNIAGLERQLTELRRQRAERDPKTKKRAGLATPAKLARTPRPAKALGRRRSVK